MYQNPFLNQFREEAKENGNTILQSLVALFLDQVNLNPFKKKKKIRFTIKKMSIMLSIHLREL